MHCGTHDVCTHDVCVRQMSFVALHHHYYNVDTYCQNMFNEPRKKRQANLFMVKWLSYMTEVEGVTICGVY